MSEEVLINIEETIQDININLLDNSENVSIDITESIQPVNISVESIEETVLCNITKTNEIINVTISNNGEKGDPGTTDHAELTHLDYESSGHTGFASEIALANKVDKEVGKGLSTNDYTNIDKNKLSSIEYGAEVNVNADWDSTSGDSEILNKPNIPTKTSDLINDSGFINEEVDPIFTSSPAYNITNTEITNWNTSYTNTHTHTNKSFLDLVSGTNTGDETTSTIKSKLGVVSNYVDGYLTSSQYITLSNKQDYLGYTPVPNSRTITINGTTYDLTANRSWSVGDLLSTGSYSNPLWLISLAWSKITSTPTTLSGYGVSVNDTLFDNKYQSMITAGTTSQYWRGDKTWQTLDKTAVGLNNVENIALSTWSGSTNLTTLGTIVTGTWHGNPITDSYISSANNWNTAYSNRLSSLTVNGNSGSATLINNVLNIPTYTLLGLGIPATPINPTQSYLNGNLQWAEIAIGSGGNASNIYFSLTNSDVSGYKTLSYTPDPTETQHSNSVTNTETLFVTYLGPLQLGVTVINAGTWSFSSYIEVDKTTGTTQLKYEPFVRHLDGSETTLFSVYSDPITTTTFKQYTTATTQNAFTVIATDRLGVRVYGKTTSSAAVIITRIVGDGRGAYFTTSLPLRHTQLRSLNDDVNNQHVTTTQIVDWNNAYTHSTTTTGSVHGATTVGGNFFRLTNPSAITFPRINADNTVSALSASDFRTAIGAGTSTVTPSALTKVDDTNVTLTLGGTPSTALLQGVSLTLGWNGTLADSRIASATTWNAKQNAYTNLTSIGSLTNANGFLRQNGSGVFSYDTNTYYLASNPNGYITSSVLSGYATSTHTHNLARYSLCASSYLDDLTTSNFRTRLFGQTTNGYYLSVGRWNSSVPSIGKYLQPYGTMIAWAGDDTQGFIAADYNNHNAVIGGGVGDSINWSETLLHSGNFGSYATPLNGTGANGTWGISISGTATNANTWNSQTYYSGGLSTINFLMAYENSSNRFAQANLTQVQSWLGLGSAAYTSIETYVLAKPNISVSFDTVGTYGNAMGMVYASDGIVNGWNHFINVSYNWEAGNMWQTQIAVSPGSVDKFGIRSRQGATGGTGGWSSWYTIYNAANLSTLKTDLGLGSNAYTSTAYLPLTAGASYPLTGNLTVPSITIITGAGTNKVLTSDSSGNATWQTPTTGNSSSGTYTPSYSGYSNCSNATTTLARYTKVNNDVHVYIKLSLTATSGNSSMFYVTVPFTGSGNDCIVTGSYYFSGTAYQIFGNAFSEGTVQVILNNAGSGTYQVVLTIDYLAS